MNSSAPSTMMNASVVSPSDRSQRCLLQAVACGGVFIYNFRRSMMRIERAVVINRPVNEVFDFIAEPGNGPRWCHKVLSVEQVEGLGPGPGSRYAVVHRPVPGRPPRNLTHFCVAWEPPHRVEWREDDGTDLFLVEYSLEATPRGTRLQQRSEAELGVARLLRPIFRAGIGRDITKQLRALKRLLEAGS